MSNRYLSLVLLGVIGALAAEPKRDRYGDPLPEGAIARLGSLRLRTELPIVAAAFTAGGKTLVVCDTNFIYFWDPVTGKKKRRVELKSADRVWRWCLSADGKTLIQSGLKDVLRFVDTAGGAEPGTLNHAQGGFIQALNVSRDAKILVAVHRESIALWDVSGGKLLHEFMDPRSGQPTANRAIALTPDGKQLVLGHADGSLHLMDTASGKEIRAIERPPLRPDVGPEPTFLVAISPDGRYLAYGDAFTPLTLCELATGKRLHELAPPQGVISGLAFTPNGRFLAVDDYEHARIRLFGVQSGKEIRKMPLTIGRRALPLNIGVRNLLVFSPDGRTLAVLGGYGINLWDVADSRPLHPPIGHEDIVRSMVFFPDGKRLISTDCNHGTIVWDIASGRSLAQRRNNYSFASLAVEGDGESVRFADYCYGVCDVAVHRWDLRTGRAESRQIVSGLFTDLLALSPDGRSMAVQIFKAPRTPELRLYDRKTNKSLVLPGLPPQGWITQMEFTPDSRRLAARDTGGVLHLWDRETGKLVREFQWETSGGKPVHLTAFASDGRSFAQSEEGNMVRIRETAGGAERLRIPIETIPSEGHLPFRNWNSVVEVLAYSPDARYVACSQPDGRVLAYSAVSGKRLAQWQGKQGGVRSLAFSRDSRLLASGGDNGTILIWEVPKDETLPAVLKTEKAISLWQALGDSDAAAANRALAGLTAAPAQTLPLFKERLRPLGKPLDRGQLARLIAELDDDSFQVRERATRALAVSGPDAADALRQALSNDPSPESKRRIRDLLARLKPGDDPKRLRFVRAIEILERIGTPQAGELLRELAGKPLPAELHQDIEASLRRMGAKP